MKKQKFACFDLFDTVLFRSVLAPSDVFRIVYLDLVEEQILDKRQISEDAFVAARRHAEATARIGVEECTLEDIWDHLASNLGKDCAPLGARLEEDAERRVLYPNDDIVSSLRKRRENGEQIVFISDMYLSTRFLKSVLVELDIWASADRIFVSSDVGAQKHTGRLYAKVRAELGGTPRSFHMTGDNRRSDVLRARLAGWRARHYRGGRLNRYERTLLQKLRTDRLQTSTLIGTIRKYRCAEPDQPTSRFMSDFLGLASLFWALWAIRQAEANKVTRLKFAARDGFQAWVAADTLQQLGLASLHCDYFYSSRASLYFANIVDLETDLDWIEKQSSGLTAEKVFSLLNIDLDLAKSILPPSLVGDTVLSSDDFRNLKRAISQSDLADTVLRTAENQRALILEFFEQEHMTGSESWAVVDIGWHLNVQTQIAQIVGVDRTKGYYLYLSEDRLPPALSGAADAMIPARIGDFQNEPEPGIWRYTTVAEHLLSMAPHGTTTSYDRDDAGKVIPVCKRIGESEVQGKKAIAADVRRFVEQNGPTFSALFNSADACAEVLRHVTDTFLDRPTRQALQSLPDLLSVGRSMNNEDDKKLLKPIGFSDVLTALLVLLRIKRRGNFEWLHGRLVMTGPIASIGIGLSNFLRRE